DSDDLWEENKLEEQLQFMKDNDLAFTFSAYQKINPQGQPLGVMGAPSKINYRQLLKTNVIGCLTAIYDTEKLQKVYMPLIRKRQDFGLWLKILKQTPYGYGIALPLARYTVRADSISSN